MLFLLFSFFFFHCSTLLVNRDGTNLIGKSSGFPNPVFREQIQLDVDRSNSKLLPFSLVKLERYGDRFLSKGEGEKNLHLSKSNRVKRRKIRISICISRIIVRAFFYRIYRYIEQIITRTCNKM